MIFSELSLLPQQTGLAYDEENAELYGQYKGYNVAIQDNGEGAYILKIFCRVPENALSDIDKFTDVLPKNAIIRKENAKTMLTIRLYRDVLLQENLPYVIDFLDRLTAYLVENKCESLELVRAAAANPAVEALKDAAAIKKNQEPSENEKSKIGKNNFKGLLGSFVGCLIGFIIMFISVIINDSVFPWIAGVVIAILAVVGYTKFTYKADLFGIISATVLSAITTLSCSFYLAAFSIFDLIGEEARSSQQINVFTITSNMSEYFREYPSASDFFVRLALTTTLLAVVGVIISSLVYTIHSDTRNRMRRR